MRLLAIAALAGLLAACATQTPYQASPGGESGYGFTEQAIESNRVRITFRGNTLTDRETVETYLLYRAAETTLERGYDYFTVVDRNLDSNTRLQPMGGDRYGYFPYSYRYYSPYWGWRPWYDPFFDDPVSYRQVTRYEASAEIIMGRGAKPDEASAYNAREVKANLEASIVRPPPPAQ